MTPRPGWSLFKLGDVLLLGLHGIVVHKVRSVLTVLGILFGVWSVIAMLAINAGLSYESQQALRELGSDNIIIDSIRPSGQESSAGGRDGFLLEYGLTPRDVAKLRGNIPGVVQHSVVHRTLKYAYTDGKPIMVTVLSTEPNYPQVARTELLAGRFISDADVLQRKPYCVLTAPLARRLFAFHDPLGQTLSIGAEPFTVIGVIRRLPGALAGQTSTGGSVLVPMVTDLGRWGKVMFIRKPGGLTLERNLVSQVIFQMTDEQAVLDGAKIARSLLKRLRGDQADYEVRVPVEQIELMKSDRKRWNFMFFMIASVSLLVGGIGIMNIMLASVTERTREIGIRRALGARRRDITVQFLVEAVALTTVGGLLGIAVGRAVPWAVETFLEFKTIISTWTLILPLAMAMAVGLISGLYPALRAAKLDPIEALRHE